MEKGIRNVRVVYGGWGDMQAAGFPSLQGVK
jgi:hypothetical protein